VTVKDRRAEIEANLCHNPEDLGAGYWNASAEWLSTELDRVTAELSDRDSFWHGAYREMLDRATHDRQWALRWKQAATYYKRRWERRVDLADYFSRFR
jgi:hypothetical protein